MRQSQTIIKTLFNFSEELKKGLERTQFWDAQEATKSWVEPRQKVKTTVALALGKVRYKLAESSLGSLTDQEIINLFLELDAQDYLFDISPNSYWAWCLIHGACLFLDNNNQKITKKALEKAAKDLSKGFLRRGQKLIDKYPNLSVAEISLLSFCGYLLIQANSQEDTISTVINPILTTYKEGEEIDWLNEEIKGKAQFN